MTTNAIVDSPAVADTTALLVVKAVARLLGCSARHVYRLSDSGRMPAPVKIGALVRWSRQAIANWISAGCPCCRKVNH
jgi:excisionase family DNA binding protein